MQAAMSGFLKSLLSVKLVYVRVYTPDAGSYNTTSVKWSCIDLNSYALAS